ncbi:hypothetical protein [Rhodococcus sp. BE178]|uniref:hypothetical protein n=1 Tax=Rhodococcus sp. BE178 TaxID=2817737 RepID=UPI003D216A46
MTTDFTTDAITRAVTLGRDGDPDAARADALTNDRVRQHHAGLVVRGFYPSLHLNLADNLRRLGSFDQAREHLDAAGRYFDALGDDGYGAMIRTAVDEVGVAVTERSVEPRPSHP